MKCIAVLTSGGDSPGMNACIRAVVRYGISQGLTVFGIKRGYQGLIEDDMELMSIRSVGNIIQQGGTFLKTARCKEFKKDEVIDEAVKILRRRGIEGLVVIGGDGTFRGAERLIERGILCACVPATIDNNLFYTDYTLGFDTATNTVVDLINRVRDTSLSHDRVFIAETMGAGCGDLALKAGLAAGADMVIVPEIHCEIDDIVKKLLYAKSQNKKFSMIVLSERVFDTNELKKILTEKSGIECRTIVFGHIQRGGSPSAFDRNLGTNFGVRAIQELMNHNCGVVGYKNGAYIFDSIDYALSVEQKFNYEEYKLIENLSI